TVMLPQKIMRRDAIGDFRRRYQMNVKEQAAYRESFRAPEARILVVDDTPVNHTVLKELLKKTQVIIDCAYSGKECIDMVQHESYDLIFLDHMMPDPDGLRTLKKIRSDARSLNQDTTAIVLTANAIAGSRQFYLDAGFADYLCKPVPSKSLEETVKKYLPQGKIKPAAEGQEKQTEDVSARPEEMPMQPVSEAMPAGAITVTEVDTVPEKWSSIEGLDYRTAVAYCGDEEVFEAVAEEIVKGSREKADLIREAFGSRDIETYRIKAHAIKSDMATIGAKDLSERAKQHEFAAKDQDLSFMEKDMDSFLKEYEEFCDALRGALAGE
ncbi:MAG: response regulator, partial [Lachnospiraceae bacterium]|nr:response regulator [Lachnospiraceae bacterium]